MSSLEKADYECPVKLNTSEREGVNKQNDLKPKSFFFLKTHLSSSERVGQNRSVIMVSVILLSVIMPSVVVPFYR
jgi:hypothetical protein